MHGKTWAGLSLLLVVLAACSPAAVQPEAPASPTEIAPTARASSEDATAVEADPATSIPETLPTAASILNDIEAVTSIELAAVPELDTSLHNVPLDEIIFDTFRLTNRAVPLTEIQPALARSLRDAIPPLYDPNFVSATEGSQWLHDSALILGYADGGEAFAYPVTILNYHEMVSHEVNGRPVLASYCPLCRSGMVYERTLPDTSAPLVLGNTSALFESDMVMFDHQTGSYWNQVTGEAIAGPLTGQRMTLLPAQMATWGQWKELYPHAFVLSEDTGFDRNYNRDPFVGYGQRLNTTGQFAFPVSSAALDRRLEPGDIVLGVEVDGQRRAYPLEGLGDAAVNDRLGDEAIVIFSRAEGTSANAFRSKLNGRTLTFDWIDGQYRDRETGSAWNQAGWSTEGEYVGAQLEAVPARTSFWFSLVANYPSIEVYDPGEND